MSSSYIIEPQESVSKKDDTLIIVVNDDGTISVDQETLQNLIMNQSNANVSVVRLGQTEGDMKNGDITLTVDPPSFTSAESNTSATPNTDPSNLVDPFMEMDPEQLERLETALQSEEAKQILGENVTAMLDMLSVEEQQNSAKHSIQLDHCYTSRLSPSDPKPSDPLPIANSPDIDDMEYMHSSLTSQSVPTTTTVSTDVINTTTSAARGKAITKTGKPVGRPRGSKSNVSSSTGMPKSISDAASKNTLHIVQQEVNKGALVPLIKRVNMNEIHTMPITDEETNNEEDLSSSSSESSESEEPSDNDSDFGPRGPRRGGIRARGGRKGLTTRGGSMAATRRRGPNKQMNMEQVRRLDMEMAAAVNAMKSPEKEDKTDKSNTLKPKKQLRTFGGKKKDETTATHGTVATETPPMVVEKPLQTTNQVKANLINANMIKGDMILTKPGQMRNNQKVIFVQKQVMMKANELKNLNLKKQTVVPKGNAFNQISAKVTTTKDGKLLALPGSKIIMQTSQAAQSKTILPQISLGQQQQSQGHQVAQQLPQKIGIPSTPVKVKPLEVKKEKKKPENLTESVLKSDVDLGKLVEPKTPDGTKKHQKKDHRKSPSHLVDALGPALFSTPDIIRRVSSSSDSKMSDTPLTPSTPTSLSVPTCTAVSTMTISTATMTFDNVTPMTATTTVNSVSVAEARMTDTDNPSLQSELQMEGQSQTIDGQRTDVKVLLGEDLHSSLDPASNTTQPEGVTQPMEQPIVPNHIVSESNGMEGEEHLLATLEMEASKHEEELLAEALLLQEELGVDLADHAALVDQTPAVTESLLSASTFVSPVATTIQDHTKVSNITSSTSLLNAALEQRKKGLKDEKEPIQIVRGGRIITLPPIEAPATRSKRLQTKSELPQKRTDMNKKKDKFNKQLALQQFQQNEAIDSDMDDDDEEVDNSDSEDDPDRLWCICKRPHNNRFMICCDVCEDWFHGKCVHVSKAMGQQMEEQGIEWVCPNCTKKKTDEVKVKNNVQSLPEKQQKILDSSTPHSVVRSQTSSSTVVSSTPVQTVSPSSTSDSAQVTTQFTRVTQCVVCKKEARHSSIYCSDACILTHAQEYLTKDKPSMPTSPVKAVKVPTTEVSKTKSDARVIVFERKTGKVLTGSDAPTTSNLKTWLKENPTYEVVRPNNLNTLQISGKTVTAIQTQGVGKISKFGQAAGKILQSKTIFTKSANSKQTILLPNKRIVIASGVQQQQQQGEKISPLTKPMQAKQTSITLASKNQFNPIKQVTPKIVHSQQPRSQASASPKPISNKKQETKASTSQQKVQVKSPAIKKPETEPIRLNVRKTLTELLSSRIKETNDLKLTDEEINDLAINIELEMYKFFKDTGAKYKAKYRSLVFNIKDTKNLTLFRKIADRSLTPDAVVRLSPDEMASQELAEWREKETKHQLEMIKKNELDLIAQAKSIVVKTHKGEQIIENDGGLDHVDSKTSVQDIVTALNSGDSTSSTIEDGKKEERSRSKEDSKRFKNGDEKKRKDKDREKDKIKGRSKEKRRERSQSRSRRHRSRERDHSKTRERSRDRKSIRNKDSRRDKNRDRDREREKEKDRERDKDRERERGRDKQKDKENYKKSRSGSSNRGRANYREYKERDKSEDGRKKETEKKEETAPLSTDKPIEDRLWRHVEEETSTNTLDGNESDVSDREPSSTVTIKTPDFNEEPEREKESEVERDVNKSMVQQTVWRGFVNMVDVAKFFITAQEISGHAKDLMEDLPDTVDVVGRISHDTVWDYISKMKKTGSKEILIIKLTAANDEEKIPYITLYSYLNSRSRLGVVGNVSKNIKDFYIMPFSSQSLIPQVLLPLDGPGFEDHRPHLLLGIIVRNKRKRISTIPSVIPTKIAKKEPDRSYTPPLLNIPKDKTNSATPPLSPLSHKAIAIDSLKEKQPVTQTTLETLNKAQIGMSRGAIDSATISKIVPELSSKIDLTSSPSKVPLDDDGDAPYSPGDMDDDVNDNLPKLTDTATNILSPAKNSSELQRKMDELNRQIEEQKQQIQNISSSFLGEATPTLPGLGLDPSSTNDSEEAYSPSDSRSFTPPPPGISKFSQPILDKVSDITIPPNLQEILANVKRQENSKVDPYLPSKPSATFLTSVSSSVYQKNEKYSPSLYPKNSASNRISLEKSTLETQSSTTAKETKSTLRSLSDLDLIKKAEEELAAVAAASSMQVSLQSSPLTSVPTVVSPVSHVPASPMLPSSSATSLAPSTITFSSVKDPVDKNVVYQSKLVDPIKKSFVSDQPKPPGLEDEDFPVFPSVPPNVDSTCKTKPATKFIPKSGIVLSVKRKVNEDTSSPGPNKTPRTKSRWGQGPSE